MSPAEQLRVQLERERRRDRPFEEAWEEILEQRIAWPHDTTHRREWKAILGSRSQKKVWREAYTGTGSRRIAHALAHLDLVAA